MNAIAESDESPRRPSTASSARGAAGRLGTIRPARRDDRGLPRPIRSTSAESAQSFALATQAPSDHHAESDEHAHPDESGHEPLGDRTDVAERPAASVVGVLGPFDIADDRVELTVGEPLLREGGHHVGPYSHRLRNLRRRRLVEWRRHGARDIPAARDDLMAPGAVAREEELSLRQVSPVRIRPGDGRPGTERADVGDERIDLARSEQQARTPRLDTDPAQRHVARREVEVGGERADPVERRTEPGLDRLVAARPTTDARRGRAPGAVRAVAGDAVATVELLSALDLRPRGRESGRGGQKHDGYGEEEPHPWWQVRLTTVATVVSTTIRMKSR